MEFDDCIVLKINITYKVGCLIELYNYGIIKSLRSTLPKASF